MNSVTFHTQPNAASGWVRMLGLAVLAAGAWTLSAGTAQARDHNDVYWSIGVNSPGVAVGVSNAPPPRVVYERPVVVYPPAPVVVHQPYPRYEPRHYPYVRPVIVQPNPVLVYPGWDRGPRWEDRYERRHWRHKHHHRSDRWDRDDRYDRDDDDRRGGHR